MRIFRQNCWPQKQNLHSCKRFPIANTVYSEFPKIMLTIVVEDARLEAAVNAIQSGAKTGQHGDGKIFISPVDAVYTVRTGQRMQD